MTTNTQALGKPKAAAKGEPPKRSAKKPVITENTRADDAGTKGIQFMVPPAVIEEFGREAGEVFGFTKGAKSQMFLKLWNEYKRQKS